MENERNLMTTAEAARYLGLKPSYLYKMMMRRADENLLRFQGGGGTGVPAIPARCQREPKLMPNRNGVAGDAVTDK